MLAALLSNVVWFVLTLPLRVILAVRFSAIFTLAGFILGLLGGIIFGYFAFIYPEPSDYKEVRQEDFVIEDRELTNEERKGLNRLLPPWVHSPDIERVRWFNTLLLLMWPYVDKAVSAEIKAQAMPIIDQSKPKFIESIEFEEITLGSIPPGITGIKSFDTKEDEVIIQPILRWIARPNIKVVVRVFGLALSAQLTHLQVEVPARITLKPLSNYFPCFSKIVVSLMAAPKVDLGLSILGLDFLAFPAIRRIVEEQVEAALEETLLWPVAMTIYEEEARPVLGNLFIRDISARSLRNVAGVMAKIDPYVKFGFGRKIGNFKTKVEKDTTSPEWELEGRIPVHNKEDPLQIEVWHQKKPKDVLIGWTELYLSELEDNAEKSFMDLKLFSEMPDRKHAAAAGAEAAAGTDAPGAAPPGTGPATSNKNAATKVASLRPTGTSNSRRFQSSRDRDCGTISFKLEYNPKVGEKADDEEEEEAVVIPKSVPVGGGLLWVKLRSGRGLEAKKGGYTHPIVALKFRGQEQKSLRYKESDIELFDDAPFTWECKDRPVKESLYVKVIAEAKGPSLSTVTNPLALKRLLHTQELVGHVEIPLRDVIANGRMLDDYSLVDSKNGSLKIEIRWADQLPEEKTAPGRSGTDTATTT